jgi:hypothetical protein
MFGLLPWDHAVRLIPGGHQKIAAMRDRVARRMGVHVPIPVKR